MIEPVTRNTSTSEMVRQATLCGELSAVKGDCSARLVTRRESSRNL